MTPIRWVLFVEGPSDRTFMKALLHHFGIVDVEIEIIGGGLSHLRHVATVIRRHGESGNRVALVLDANTKPKKRLKDAVREVQRLDLPVSRILLLPDDDQPGDLETVLEGSAVPQHRVIYECFEQYERCVRRRSQDYALPNRKARVFAYCEALGAETNPAKRDYNNPEHWDLDAAILKPLKHRLLSLDLE